MNMNPIALKNYTFAEGNWTPDNAPIAKFAESEMSNVHPARARALEIGDSFYFAQWGWERDTKYLFKVVHKIGNNVYAAWANKDDELLCDKSGDVLFSLVSGAQAVLRAKPRHPKPNGQGA